MQFKVPQNVQIEDKILPFMTLRQLIICAIGGGFAYILYLGLELQPTEVWLPPVGIIVALTLAIAFFKINDIPFVQYILLILERYLSEGKRHWMKSAGDIFVTDTSQKKKVGGKAPEKKHLTQKEIKELSRNLDASELKQVKSN